MPRAICRDACLLAAKCSNSATLPGRAGGESLGLATTKGNVILLQYDPPPPCGRSPSVTGPFTVAAAAFRAQTPGACRGLDRADLGRGAVGHPMTSSAIAALGFHDLTLGYDRHPAVHHLDGVVEQGSLTAVVGPNGAGKSTLFKAIVGAIKPLAGTIERNGFDPRAIAYLPQAAEIDRSFPINVYDMVAMGFWRRKGLFGSIGTLSGGQMQRMLFARLLVQDARVIVLDEPFSAIDGKTVADLMHLVRQWHWERRTVLAATHDIELVRAYFPQTLLLAREPVAWGATREVLTAENLDRARRMCEAFDETAEACASEAA